MSRTPAGPRKVLRWLRKRLLPPPPPVPSPAMLAQDRIAEGNQARERREWATAAAAYRAALAHRPGDAAILIQQGHMLKEAGALAEAEAAYRAATEAAPLDAEPWLQRAHALKALGRSDDAIDAFVEALRRDPKALGARDELISVGARHRLPRPVYGSGPSIQDLAVIGRSLDASLKAIRDWVQVSTYPLDAWDAFRRAYPVAPPPPGGDAEPLVVVVDAVGGSPPALARTLDSLLNQKYANWTALVQADAVLRTHPVASLKDVDRRIAFDGPGVEGIGKALSASKGARILALPAGVVLVPEALAWFLAAALRTGAEAVYADHDHHEDHWRLGPLHQQPALQSMPDADDLATSPRPPVAVLLGPDRAADLIGALSSGVESAALGRALLVAVMRDGGAVAHLPRLLSSVWIGSAADGVPAPLERPVAAEDTGRLLVVIPTRDQSVLLKACIESLRAFADSPEALDILVVDNGSIEDETRQLLAGLSTLAGVEIVVMDEPFNWARLNTVAVQGRTPSVVVFANNDVEAISAGWDTIVRRELARPDVGVVGARLVYDDHTLQHGGIVLGAAEGRPMHEGLGAGPLDDGPMGRYRRTRPVAAVTGAFMAVRRETFERLGGFDDRLAVGYNDIDFCLRVRSDGLKVVFAADLTLIHRESRTRGLNDSAEKIAWDDTELKRLHNRWGPALFQDPGVNPHWGSGPGRPMDGYCDPTLTQVLAWLDHSVRRGPWTIGAADKPSG